MRHPFRLTHFAWAILIVGICVALVFMGGGHPPPMVFVPHVLVAGVLGHLLLLGVAWLARRGRSRVETARGAAAAWPFELTLAALALGAVTAVATGGAFSMIGLLRTRPFEWLIVFAIAATHAAAFLLLLLRKPATRVLLVAISLCWAAALVWLLREARPGELPVAIALIAGLIGLAAYFLRSARVRSAFA